MSNCMGVQVTQSCPILCNPMDCSLPGCFVHGILRARILEWVAISFSQGSLWPEDQTHIFSRFCTDRQILYHRTTEILEKEMVTHSNVLAREIPWTEEPGGPHVLDHRKGKRVPEKHLLLLH